jgi:hypothetical protein
MRASRGCRRARATPLLDTLPCNPHIDPVQILFFQAYRTKDHIKIEENGGVAQYHLGLRGVDRQPVCAMT